MQRFIPTIGESGSYEVLPPYQIPATERNTCKSIRRLSEVIKDGKDPYELYYKDHGIDRDVFDTHLKEDVELIFLQNDAGFWRVIPSTALRSYPNMNGIPYRRGSLVFALPAFPVGQSFEQVETQCANLIEASLGIRPKAKFVVNSVTNLIPTEEHNRISAERQQQAQGDTDFVRAAFWKKAYDDLLVKMNILLESHRP